MAVPLGAAPTLAAADPRAVFVCCAAVVRARYVRPAGAAPLEPDRGVQRICAPARTGCRRERRTARRHRRLLVRSTLDPAVPTLTSSAPPAPAPAQRCRRPSGHQPLPWVALSAPCSAVIDTDMPRHASVLQWRRKTGASAAAGCGLWAVARGPWASAAVCRYEKDELKTTMFVQRAGWNTISTMMYPIGGRPDSKTLLVRLLKPRARGWLL